MSDCLIDFLEDLSDIFEEISDFIINLVLIVVLGLVDL